VGADIVVYAVYELAGAFLALVISADVHQHSMPLPERIENKTHDQRIIGTGVTCGLPRVVQRLDKSILLRNRRVRRRYETLRATAPRLGTEPKPIGKGIGLRPTVRSFKIDEHQHTAPENEADLLLSDAREVNPLPASGASPKHFNLRW
jgi:hypothetical protein